MATTQTGRTAPTIEQTHPPVDREKAIRRGKSVEALLAHPETGRALADSLEFLKDEWADTPVGDTERLASLASQRAGLLAIDEMFQLAINSKDEAEDEIAREEEAEEFAERKRRG